MCPIIKDRTFRSVSQRPFFRAVNNRKKNLSIVSIGNAHELPT